MCLFVVVNGPQRKGKQKKKKKNPNSFAGNETKL